ncbi:hypothetical protein ACFWY9_04790 [Amycolatopsis sp. NPDC059027]|uniref:hypothetical protein n=1 Tax=Amycolatopsis sp. NPDC059027 TaxID=3346709 RepID=UPI00366D5BF7
MAVVLLGRAEQLSIVDNIHSMAGETTHEEQAGMSDACERIEGIMRQKGFNTVSRSEAIA